MPECHTCPVSKKIESGEYADKTYAETPCATCALGRPDFALSHHGQTHVSVDHCPERELAVPSLLDVDDVEENGEAFDRVSLFLASLMSLPSVTRDVVCLRFLDGKGVRHTYADIGHEYDMSPQAAESHHKRALNEFPVIGEMFKIKQIRRAKRHGN